MLQLSKSLHPCGLIRLDIGDGTFGEMCCECHILSGRLWQYWAQTRFVVHQGPIDGEASSTIACQAIPGVQLPEKRALPAGVGINHLRYLSRKASLQ
jgi:hypothetical protein